MARLEPYVFWNKSSQRGAAERRGRNLVSSRILL